LNEVSPVISSLYTLSFRACREILRISQTRYRYDEKFCGSDASHGLETSKTRRGALCEGAYKKYVTEQNANRNEVLRSL